MSEQIASWWRPVLEQMGKAHADAKVSHAIILSGGEGLGIELLANDMAKALLCQSRKVPFMACGQCKSCLLVDSNAHPDFKMIVPEEDGRVIKVDQIREFSRFVSLSSQFGRWKVGVVAPAEAMNQNAANSLLKTLEEPQGDTLILLVSSQIASLIPTIRSRCQNWTLTIPGEDVCRDWALGQGVQKSTVERLLTKHLGGPYALLDWADSVDLWQEQVNGVLGFMRRQVSLTQLSDAWSKDAFDKRAKVTLWLMLDAMKANESVALTYWQSPELESQIREISRGMTKEQLYNTANIAMKLTKYRQGQANPQLLWEEFLIHCRPQANRQLSAS